MKRLSIHHPGKALTVSQHCKCAWCEYGKDPGSEGICHTCHSKHKLLLQSQRWRNYRQSRLLTIATAFCADPFNFHGYKEALEGFVQTLAPLTPLYAHETIEGHVLTPGTVIDHIQPWRYFPSLFWTVSNHQTLCQTCHNHKTSLDGSFNHSPKSSF